MRFYNQQHGFYCGVDLHARMLAVCILDAEGRIVFEGKLAAGPDTFRQAIPPFRTSPVGCLDEPGAAPAL